MSDQMSSNISAWLSAFRLRTLPLALSTIALGTFLAIPTGNYSWLVFALAAVTAFFLQILSNLANDYGDGVKGTDNQERVGPERAIQSGAISVATMKKAMYLFAFFALLSGVALIYYSLAYLGVFYLLAFFLLGIASIWAAVKYTAGDNAYGYSGYGDIFVFLFFGLVGVAGTYFLHTHQFHWSVLLPASSLGLFSAGVLNLNNMRDIKNDAACGKNTLVVKMGSVKARYYHIALLISGFGAAIAYGLISNFAWQQWLFVLIAPLLLLNIQKVINNKVPRELDPELKKLALSTLLFVVLWGIGLLF